jgi:hemerythrin
MAFLAWRNEFSTGIAEVDHEHQELIHLINEVFARLVQTPNDPRIIEFLGEVHSRIAAHFALEEKVMRQRRFAGFPAHKNEHEALLNEMREIMDKYEVGGYATAEGDLARTLGDWFGNHFRTQDAVFHRAIGAQSGSGMP